MAVNGEVNTSAGGVAVIAATDDYTAGLGNLFAGTEFGEGTWGFDNICTRTDYTRPTTDYATVIQSTMDNGCSAVALFAYNADGAAIITELRNAGFTGEIYGTDGIASVTTADSMSDDLLDGVWATNPGTADGARGALVDQLWPTDLVPQGQFAKEAFDAFTIMAFSAFTQLATIDATTGIPGITSSQAIMATGTNWDGATGPVNFLANGDTLGQGYCVGQFTVTDVGADGEGTVSYDCSYDWGFDNGLVATTSS